MKIDITKAEKRINKELNNKHHFNKDSFISNIEGWIDYFKLEKQSYPCNVSSYVEIDDREIEICFTIFKEISNNEEIYGAIIDDDWDFDFEWEYGN